MNPGLWVTGTDTGVGKTVVCCALLAAMRAKGLCAVGMKPVSAGCEWVQGEWVNEDVIHLRRASSLQLPTKLINPYAFAPPIAPHIAAAQAGITIDLHVIRECYLELSRQSQVVVVEGVGGFKVPLNDREDTQDLAVLLGLPVVLVVGMRLGCLNHALLSAAAIRDSGLNFAGWVANQATPKMSFLEDNVTALKERLTAPFLGLIPHLVQDNPEEAARYLQTDPVLFRAI
jgi:dethiobiotin synthetase